MSSPHSDNGSLSSSLPKSLRQHLYTSPRQHLHSSPHLPLPPLVSPPLPVDPIPAAPPSLLDLAGAAAHPPTIPPQRPIYSDPVFHTSRASSLSRIINQSAPPEDPYARRHSWREGEAGPSTLGPPPKPCDPVARRLQPKNETVPYLLPREELWQQNNRDPWPETGPRSPRHHDQGIWAGRDASLVPFDHRMASPFTETQSNPEFQRRFSMNPSPSPQHTATSHSVPAGFYAQFQANDHRDPLRLLSASTTIDHYTLPPPASNSPSPSTFQSRTLSPRLASSYSETQNPNPTHGDTSSHHLAQKRTKTPVACEFCRGRKLKCDGDKPRCKNCYERRFECRYPTFQRRRGPGKAPKGSRARKRAVAVASSSNINEREASHMATDRSSHELEALAPEVRQYTSVINLDRYTFEPPAEAPHYPSAHIPRPPGRASTEDQSEAEEMNRNTR